MNNTFISTSSKFFPVFRFYEPHIIGQIREGVLYEQDTDFQDKPILNEFNYVNDKLHKDNGPAVIYHDKFDDMIASYWYKHGKLHRTDGPAVECSNGKKDWFIDNIKINVNSDEEFEQWKKLMVFL